MAGQEILADREVVLLESLLGSIYTEGCVLYYLYWMQRKIVLDIVKSLCFHEMLLYVGIFSTSFGFEGDLLRVR